MLGGALIDPAGGTEARAEGRIGNARALPQFAAQKRAALRVQVLARADAQVLLEDALKVPGG